MPLQHSDTVGGSTAARVIACPGSVKLCREAPPKTTSIYARTGTMLHSVMELYLQPDDPKDGLKNVETAIGLEIDGVRFTRDHMIQKIEPCIEWFEDVLAPDDFYVETKCRFPGIPGAFGTADIIYKKGEEYGVADWKFGDGVPVKIESNAQIMFYLWAAYNTKPNFFPRNLQCMRGHIFQPFRNADMEKHRFATFTMEELKEFEALLLEAVGIAERDGAPLAIGDHCRWCAAKSTCPILRDTAATLMDQNDRTPTQMLQALAHADSLEELVKEIRSEAADWVRRGGKLPGYKLTRTFGNRFFVEGAEAKLRKRGLRVKDIMVHKLDTPAGVERAIKKAGKKIDISDLTDRKVTGDKLVLETAKGDPIENPINKLKQVAKLVKAKNLRG